MKKTYFMSALVLAASFTSSIAHAAADEPTKGDASSADIQWVGHAKVIPGDNITITGENGSSEIMDGKLVVNPDGTFTTSTPVNLESRLYKDGKVGDLISTTWTLDAAKPLSVTWGTNIVAGIDPSVQDRNTGVILSNDGKTGVARPRVSLQLSNNTPATKAPVDPQAELTVNATILATVA